MPNTCKNCSAKIPRQVIIENVVRNLGSRKFCLSCSPFESHNTSSRPGGQRMIDVNCESCGEPFLARVVDRTRGLGRFCSLRCSARRQQKITETNAFCAFCRTPLRRNGSRQRKSRSGLMFCNRACKEAAQRIGPNSIPIIQPEHYGDGASSYRTIARGHLPNRCARCRYSRCLAALEVHHRDGDHSNNTLENFEILCANCHREEHFMVEASQITS